jgi:transcriptional regulator with XRE-family HTH domain
VSRIRDLHGGPIKEPEYPRSYEALEGEFALAAAVIRGRTKAGPTQEQLAPRMGTEQDVVARWQGGNVMPSTRTLTRVAKATGTMLRNSFAPIMAVARTQRSRKAPVSRAGRCIWTDYRTSVISLDTAWHKTYGRAKPAHDGRRKGGPFGPPLRN